MTSRVPPGVEPVEPGPGQRSVWEFPRPPAVEADERLVEVILGGEVVCRTRDSLLVLETSHPPTWYLLMADFAPGALRPTSGASVCEFKGAAEYFDIVAGGTVAPRAAWGYPEPWAGYAPLRGRVALYAALMDEVLVAGRPVEPQPGGFYGGWVTPDVVGPFKGVPGSDWW